MIRARAALCITVLQLGCATATVARRDVTGPDASVPITVVSTEWDAWDVWIGESATAPCARPCGESVPPGVLVMGTSEHPARDPSGRLLASAERPQYLARIDITGPARVRVGRWSHAGERFAGGLLVAIGLVGGVGAGVGLAAWNADECDSACGPNIVLSALIGAGWALAFSIPGGLLLDLDDHPTYALERVVLPTIVPLEGGASLGVAGTF